MASFLRRGLPIFAFALAAVLVSSSPAQGHALLLHSDPAAEARLFDPPASVTSWFSEPLEAGVSSLKVVDSTGRRVDTGATQVDPADPTQMSVLLAEELRPGFYLVGWETLSRIDGHFRFGSYQFAVLNPDGSLPPGGAFTDVGGAGDELDLDRSLVKALSLIGQAGLIGALSFYLFVTRPAALRADSTAPPARAVQRQMGSAALASVLLLAAVGVAALTIQIAEAPTGSGLGSVLETSWGDRWLQRQAVLLVAAGLLFGFSMSRERIPLLWLALIAGVAYLALTAAASHGAAIERGSFWATASDLFHLLAASVWIGGLAQLCRFLLWSRREQEGSVQQLVVGETLRRFSLLAATAVVPLLASGVINAFVQVPSLSALFETSYGLALTAKLLVVVALLAVAATNAFVLRPSVIRAAQEGESGDAPSSLFSRLVVLEASLGVAVLLVTGLLTQLTTARALAQIAGDLAFTAGSDLASPLISGGWGFLISIALLAFGVLGVVWTRQAEGCLGWTARNLSRAAVAIPVLVLLALAVDAATPEGQQNSDARTGTADGARLFQPQMSLLLQASKDRLVSLQVEPYEVGDNTFRASVLNLALQPVPVDSLVLRFSRLEREGVVGEVEASLDTASGSYFADFALQDTGWWHIEAVVDGESAASFYVRLDQPSRAPNSFAPPDYEPDPQAGALFERALARYQGLSSVSWSEELTSGHNGPGGHGVWFITQGEAVAPDELHFRVSNQEGPKSDRYYVGSTACAQLEAQPLECSEVNFRPDVFDLDFMRPTAFKLGRREAIDGEMTQVLLMYNPNQQAWYAWWVGEESGLLRRQAMVATGHFMLTHFESQNAPLTIKLPEEAPP